MAKLTIVAMNKVNYIEHWTDHCYEEQHTPEVRYEFHCLDWLNRKFYIYLTTTHGSCGSGYCNASWGNLEITPVPEHLDSFGPFTHKAIKPIEIDIPMPFDKSNYSCDAFTYDFDGGDGYYPCGEVAVNEKLFEVNARYVEKPTVFIFIGESGLGKSTMAGKFGTTIYETDSASALPDSLTADIIVLGNKYDYSIDEVRSRIKADARIIIVDFRELYTPN